MEGTVFDVVKKTFSKEAFEMVMKSGDYTEWLIKPSSKKLHFSLGMASLNDLRSLRLLVRILLSFVPISEFHH